MSASENALQKQIFDNRYEILSAIGRGRKSIVYKAQVIDSALPFTPENGLVALKIFTGNLKSPNGDQLRMKQEALAMRSSAHHNVVAFYDSVTSGDYCYLVTELVDGGDLLSLLERQDKPLDEQLALHFTAQVLGGLSAIHAAGILHRDIKPENLLVASSGRIKIADFGVSITPTSETRNRKNSGDVGTLDYLAPECLGGGQSSIPSDIYSVGVTCYYLLTKRLPFTGNTFAEIVDKKLAGEITPIETFAPTVSEEVKGLLARALTVSPEERFQSAEEFRTALLAVLQGESLEETEILSTELSNESSDKEEILENQSAEKNVRIPKNFEDDEVCRVDTPLHDEQFEAHEKIEYIKQRVQYFVQELRDHFTHFEFRQPKKPELPHINSEKFVDCVSYAREIAKTRRGQGLFLVSILLITGIGFRLSYSDSAEAHAPKNTVQFTPLANLERRGVIKNLLFDGHDVPFVFSSTTGAMDMLVTLGIPGWTPQLVQDGPLLDGGTITLNNNGLQLTLLIKKVDYDIGKVSGRYRDHGTGREGDWFASLS